MKQTKLRKSLILLIVLTLPSTGCLVSEQTWGGKPTPRVIATRMTDLRLGPLTMADGCLRIGDGGASRVVVWPPDFEVSREGDLLWVFYDDHEVEVRLGQAVSLGGGDVESIDAFDERTRRQVPSGYPGPCWLVGSITLAGQTRWSGALDSLDGTEWLLISPQGRDSRGAARSPWSLRRSTSVGLWRAVTTAATQKAERTAPRTTASSPFSNLLP
jgi:hypothetical protein